MCPLWIPHGNRGGGQPKKIHITQILVNFRIHGVPFWMKLTIDNVDKWLEAKQISLFGKHIIQLGIWFIAFMKKNDLCMDTLCNLFTREHTLSTQYPSWDGYSSSIYIYFYIHFTFYTLFILMHIHKKPIKVYENLLWQTTIYSNKNIINIDFWF